jgi:uncharacterized protein
VQPLYIPQIRQAKDATIIIVVETFLGDLETLTPVRGEIQVVHQLTYLEVTAQVETIATLVCHRCLKNYNHRLAVDTQELIWLDDQRAPSDDDPLDLQGGDFSETLPPQGHFDPRRWLYDQVSLALPLQQICGDNCPGVDPAIAQTGSAVDSRWSALAALQGQLPQTEEQPS